MFGAQFNGIILGVALLATPAASNKTGSGDPGGRFGQAWKNDLNRREQQALRDRQIIKQLESRIHAKNTPMQAVESQAMEKIGLTPAGVVIHFKSGGVYHYAGVKQEEVNRLTSAESKGGHFSKHIRPHFEAVKIGQAKKN